MAATVVPYTSPPDALRTLVLRLGSIVAADLADLAFGWPQVLISGDARYGRWLGAGSSGWRSPVTERCDARDNLLGHDVRSLLVYSVRACCAGRMPGGCGSMPAGSSLRLPGAGRGGLLGRGRWVGRCRGAVERWRAMWRLTCRYCSSCWSPLGVAAFVGRRRRDDAVARSVGQYTRIPTWTPFGIGPGLAGHHRRPRPPSDARSLATGGWLCHQVSSGSIRYSRPSATTVPAHVPKHW